VIQLTNEVVGWMFLSVVLLSAFSITAVCSIASWAIRGRPLWQQHEDRGRGEGRGELEPRVVVPRGPTWRDQ
jgi:ABC-type uncharacterized transport system permease subunit